MGFYPRRHIKQSISEILSGKTLFVNGARLGFGQRFTRTLNIRLWRDPETGHLHNYAHGFEEHEVVEDVLKSPVEDRPGRQGSRVPIGRTRGGRYLRVIYVPDPEPNFVFVITAYELIGKPPIAYRRRMRRRER